MLLVLYLEMVSQGYFYYNNNRLHVKLWIAAKYGYQIHTVGSLKAFNLLLFCQQDTVHGSI